MALPAMGRCAERLYWSAVAVVAELCLCREERRLNSCRLDLAAQLSDFLPHHTTLLIVPRQPGPGVVPLGAKAVGVAS